MDLPEFIPTELRSRLRSIQLRAGRLANNHSAGLHSSRSRGTGLEFAQYRAYEPGDGPRQIDWKLYARSDRFFVREAERESPLTLWLIIDATASAGQSDQHRPGYTRLDAMKTLTACAAEIALRQGDHFGLAAVSGGGLALVPAASGLRQRDQVWLALQRLQANGQWPSLSRLQPMLARISSNDVLMAIGDGFDKSANALLEKLAAARREVLQLQVLTCDERDFSFTGSHRFRDQETGEELLGDSGAMRADYLQRFAQAQHALQSRWRASGIRFATHYLDQTPDSALRLLFGGKGGS